MNQYSRGHTESESFPPRNLALDIITQDSFRECTAWMEFPGELVCCLQRTARKRCWRNTSVFRISELDKIHEPEMENRERRNAQKEQQDKDMGSRPQSTEFDGTGQNKDRNVLRGLADATDNWG